MRPRGRGGNHPSVAAGGAEYVKAPVAEDMDWQLRGACQSMTEWFYPDGKGKSNYICWAKRICLGCPVLQECRDWALDRGEQYGVWGGLSESDRRRIWKKGRRSA